MLRPCLISPSQSYFKSRPIFSLCFWGGELDSKMHLGTHTYCAPFFGDQRNWDNSHNLDTQVLSLVCQAEPAPRSPLHGMNLWTPSKHFSFSWLTVKVCCKQCNQFFSFRNALPVFSPSCACFPQCSLQWDASTGSASAKQPSYSSAVLVEALALLLHSFQASM